MARDFQFNKFLKNSEFLLCGRYYSFLGDDRRKSQLYNIIPTYRENGNFHRLGTQTFLTDLLMKHKTIKL